jgi:hypothetical protein
MKEVFMLAELMPVLGSVIWVGGGGVGLVILILVIVLIARR